MNLIYFIKNGMYIPIFQTFFYYLTNNIFLTFLLGSRMYTSNYYYWFSDNNYGILKQFVRFTDSGHLISLLYYLDNSYYSLAFNIHFLITFGYWIGKFFSINCEDTEKLLDFNESISLVYETINHSFHLGILIYNYDDNINLFTKTDLYMTYSWLYIWFLFIYIPWRHITGDIVYGFFDNNYPIYMKISYVIIVHSIIYISHNIGKYLL